MPKTAVDDVVEILRRWCTNKVGFRSWWTRVGTTWVKREAARFKKLKKQRTQSGSDDLVSIKFPLPPFEGATYDVFQAAAFAAIAFNRTNTQSPIIPDQFFSLDKSIWAIASHEYSGRPVPRLDVKDINDASEAYLSEFLTTLEDHFTRDALSDVIGSPTSTLDELGMLAKQLRCRASGSDWGVIAGVLGELRRRYYEIGGCEAIPPLPNTAIAQQDDVVAWLDDMISACESSESAKEFKWNQHMLQNELHKIRQSGKKWTSYTKIEKQIGLRFPKPPSRGSMQKVLKRDSELSEWANSRSISVAAPANLDAALDQTVGSEFDFQDVDDDDDRTIEYLLKKSDPDERQQINEMGPAQRRLLASYAWQQHTEELIEQR